MFYIISRYIFESSIKNKSKQAMQKIQIKTAKKMIEDGDFKCVTDLKIGRVQIKKSNGKIGVIEVI